MAKVNHNVKTIVIATRIPAENKLKANVAIFPKSTISLRLLAGAFRYGDRSTPSGNG